MTKVLREVTPKVKPDLARSNRPMAIMRKAQAIYQDVAADLPPHGWGHYDAAHDHVADRLSDQYHREMPSTHWGPVAKKALKDWVPDDRAESRANAAKRSRADARRQRERLKPKKEPAPPKIKTRRGIGSY